MQRSEQNYKTRFFKCAFVFHLCSIFNHKLRSTQNKRILHVWNENNPHQKRKIKEWSFVQFDSRILKMSLFLFSHARLVTSNIFHANKPRVLPIFAQTTLEKSFEIAIFPSKKAHYKLVSQVPTYHEVSATVIPLKTDPSGANTRTIVSHFMMIFCFSCRVWYIHI